MKSILYWFGAGILVVSLWTGRAAAQSCITFQSDYGVYTDVSTDGQKVYTSVELDGSGQMTVNSSAPGCVLPPQITHTPSTYNSTAGVGGWSSGTPQCPDCYLSSTNDQSIPINDSCFSDPDTADNCEFDYTANVSCSLVGAFFSGGGSIKIGHGVSTLKYTSIASGKCTYTLSCPNGNQNATCPSGPLVTPAPCPWEYFVGDYIVVKSKTTKQCFGFGPGGYTNIPANCQ